MKKNILLTLLILFFLTCGKEKSQTTQTESASTGGLRMEKKVAMDRMDEEADEVSENSPAPQEPAKKSPDGIGKPINPITDVANRRLLEYQISLVFKVDNIRASREKLIHTIKSDSILKGVNTNISYSVEVLNAEIYTPVDKMYDTMLALSELGLLTGETVSTVDWTEHNQEQKIKMEREMTRSSRRSKAASSGKAENWTWKDREELLERSENGLDVAKLEEWKIQDKVKWAKIQVVMQGEEAGYRIHVPRFRNAWVSSINFLLEVVYSIIWLLPYLGIFAILYFGYKWYKNRSY